MCIYTGALTGISGIVECTKVSRVPEWLYEAQHPQWPNVNEFEMTLRSILEGVCSLGSGNGVMNILLKLWNPARAL